VMAVQPAEIYMASFRGGMVYVIHKTDLYPGTDDGGDTAMTGG
jgi:hypothetical protein